MIKLQSLKQGRQFSKIFKKEKIISNYFTVYFEKNLNKKSKIKNLNISFIIKKKVGNSVKRNKIKRKLKNITNDAVKKLPLKFDYSYLVIAKETILKNNYSDIKKTMFTEFNKIK